MFSWLSGRGAQRPAPAPQPSAQPKASAPADIEPGALAAALAAADPPLLIDVRSPGEYEEGHIQGARLLPLPQLLSRVSELPKDRPIVCVCHSGSRSAMATKQLRALGYSARNMTGGMVRWRGPVAIGRAQ